MTDREGDPIITLFNGIKQTEGGKDISVLEFLQKVADGEWRPQVEAVRAEKDKAKRAALKAKLPYVTISGTFGKRNEGGLIKYSGLIAMDFDKLEDSVDDVQNALAKDSYTYAVFKSAGGKGLCALVKTSNKDNHLSHFRWLKDYYLNQMEMEGPEGGDGKSIRVKANLTVDKTQDVSRARYGSYDKEAVINFDSKVAGLKEEATPPARPAPEPKGKVGKEKPTAKPTVPPVDTFLQLKKPPDIERIINELVVGGHNLCNDYSDWLSLAFSLATLGEEGRGYFHALSTVDSGKYDPKKTDAKFDNALKTANGKKTIATFYDMAKEAGVELYTEKERKGYGYGKGKQGGKKPRGAGHSQTVDGKKAQDSKKRQWTRQKDIRDFVLKTYKIVYNDFSMEREILVEGGDMALSSIKLTDGEFDFIVEDVREYFDKPISVKLLKESLSPRRLPNYNPITDWVEKHWDMPDDPGIIDRFVDVLNYQDPKSKVFVKRWLLGIHPTLNGDPSRFVLALIGESEDTGKSDWFRLLLPTGLSTFFAEDETFDRDDNVRHMRENIIFLMDEIDISNKKQLLAFKRLTSARTFNMVEKWETKGGEYKRMASVGVTSNELDVVYGPDNTRILPVEILRFKNKKEYIKKYESINKDQLFIEIWKAGKKALDLDLTGGDLELLHEKNEIYGAYSTVDHLICYLYEKPPENRKKDNCFFCTSLEIIKYIELYAPKYLKIDAYSIGKAIKRAGFERYRVGTGRVWGYYLKKKEVLPPLNTFEHNRK